MPVRLSVRELVIFVLILGGLMGWVTLRARTQAEAVAAIRLARGRLWYDWELKPAPVGRLDFASPNPQGRPPCPDWLVRALGPDYFGTIKDVRPGRVDDALMASIGRLGGVVSLTVFQGEESAVTDAGMAHLANLPRLKHFTLPPSPGVGRGGPGGLPPSKGEPAPNPRPVINISRRRRPRPPQGIDESGESQPVEHRDHRRGPGPPRRPRPRLR